MKHGEELPLETLDGPWVKDDPEMWIGLAAPVGLRRPCTCEARCECDDEKQT